MKLLLVWASSDPEIQILIDGILNGGHEIVYWVNEHAADQYAPAGTIVHDHYEAWDGKPAPAFAGETFEPPSAAQIDKHYRLESLILTMMNKHYDSAPVDERKQMYYQMFAYWSGVLDRIRPDAIVYNSVPHSIYTYILYELARERGIDTVMFEDTSFCGRRMHYSEFWRGNDQLRAAYRTNLKKRVTEDDLGEEMREYWQTNVVHKGRDMVWYIKQQKDAAEGIGLWRIRMRALRHSWRQGQVLSLITSFIARKFQKNMRQEYSTVVQPADFSRPFVYYPLSFQPELTTSPLGNMYYNQILVAETIAAALPEGWELYVKEHPAQWYSRTKTKYSCVRYEGFYKRLASIPRVRIVPIQENTYRLTDESQTVAVVTGSAGLESLLSGKPSLVFGYPWYRDCPGIYKIESVEDCIQAFVAIQQGVKQTTPELLAYLKSFEEVSVRTHDFQPPDPRFSISPAEGNRRNVSVILAYLRKFTTIKQ